LEYDGIVMETIRKTLCEKFRIYVLVWLAGGFGANLAALYDKRGHYTYRG